MDYSKENLTPDNRFYVEKSAIKIYGKKRTIDRCWHRLRPHILEECKNEFNCDGYGNPLAEPPSEEQPPQPQA